MKLAGLTVCPFDAVIPLNTTNIIVSRSKIPILNVKSCRIPISPPTSSQIMTNLHNPNLVNKCLCIQLRSWLCLMQCSQQKSIMRLRSIAYLKNQKTLHLCGRSCTACQLFNNCGVEFLELDIVRLLGFWHRRRDWILTEETVKAHLLKDQRS